MQRFAQYLIMEAVGSGWPPKRAIKDQVIYESPQWRDAHLIPPAGMQVNSSHGAEGAGKRAAQVRRLEKAVRIACYAKPQNNSCPLRT
jgi:hypothetical protein